MSERIPVDYKLIRFDGVYFAPVIPEGYELYGPPMYCGGDERPFAQAFVKYAPEEPSSDIYVERELIEEHLTRWDEIGDQAINDRDFLRQRDVEAVLSVLHGLLRGERCDDE